MFISPVVTSYSWNSWYGKVMFLSKDGAFYANLHKTETLSHFMSFLFTGGRQLFSMQAELQKFLNI